MNVRVDKTTVPNRVVIQMEVTSASVGPILFKLEIHVKVRIFYGHYNIYLFLVIFDIIK